MYVRVRAKSVNEAYAVKGRGRGRSGDRGIHSYTDTAYSSFTRRPSPRENRMRTRGGGGGGGDSDTGARYDTIRSHTLFSVPVLSPSKPVFSPNFDFYFRFVLFFLSLRKNDACEYAADRFFLASEIAIVASAQHRGYPPPAIPTRQRENIDSLKRTTFRE